MYISIATPIFLRCYLLAVSFSILFLSVCIFESKACLIDSILLDLVFFLQSDNLCLSYDYLIQSHLMLLLTVDLCLPFFLCLMSVLFLSPSLTAFFCIKFLSYFHYIFLSYFLSDCSRAYHIHLTRICISFILP